MQSNPLNVWGGDSQPSQPAQSTQPAFRPAFQPQPKPKLNKTIIYTIAGVLAVVAAVVAPVVLRSKGYADAIATIDSVKDVAVSQNVKLGNDFHETMANTMDKIEVFFTETNKSPSETLFNTVKSPEEGLAKYKIAMDKLAANHTISGDKNLAQKFAATKSIYEKFNQHATATTKYYTFFKSDIIDMEKALTDYTSDSIEQYEYTVNVISKFINKLDGFKSGDDKFDKIVRDAVNSTNKFLQLLLNYKKHHPKPDNNIYNDTSISNASFELVQNSTMLNGYINDTVDYRNRFVDSLAYLRAELVKAR